MDRKTPTSIGEFTAVIKRRKFWILVPFALTVALGILLAPFVPRTYRSVTTIMVVPQKVQSPYAQKDASMELVNRIQNIGLEITSGDAFAGIINRLNLYPELRRQGKINGVLSMMRKNTTVAQVPDTGDGRGGAGAFTISYIDGTPARAQEVTKELADYFVNQNASQTHLQAQNTDAFLTAQLATAQQQLAAQEAKIQAFKAAHVNSLPEQAQANLQSIMQYQGELQTTRAAIDQDNQQRVYLQSVLRVNPGSSGQGTAEAPAAPTPLQIELAKDEEQLNADLARYTPQYPDVIRLKDRIAALKVQIHDAPKTAATPTTSVLPFTTGPTVNDQLRSQLLALNADIKTREDHARQIQQMLAQLQSTVGTAPAVQTEYASLDSTYQEMQKNYDTLLEKQHEAAMTAAMYQHDNDGQLVVVQPASMPTAPYRPDPVLLYTGIVLIAVLIGFVCALVVELGDDTMHDSDEVSAYLKLPVIIALPKYAAASDATWSMTPGKK